MERDVTVVVHLAERDAEPVRRANLNDCVDREIEELPDSEPGGGEELDTQSHEGVVFLSGADE
jgi:hypothetical protein